MKKKMKKTQEKIKIDFFLFIYYLYSLVHHQDNLQ
jgi:hypothetical protein